MTVLNKPTLCSQEWDVSIKLNSRSKVIGFVLPKLFGVVFRNLIHPLRKRELKIEICSNSIFPCHAQVLISKSASNHIYSLHNLKWRKTALSQNGAGFLLLSSSFIFEYLTIGWLIFQDQYKAAPICVLYHFDNICLFHFSL